VIQLLCFRSVNSPNPPLEQLRRAVAVDQVRNVTRYPAAPTKRPTIAP
jgi:hypothetical protein